MSESTKTTDHDQIRRWADERQGRPVAVKNTGNERNPGILRIDFPGGAGEESLEPIPWEEWFSKFEDNKLAALLQDRTADGKTSRFIKLVAR